MYVLTTGRNLRNNKKESKAAALSPSKKQENKAQLIHNFIMGTYS